MMILLKILIFLAVVLALICVVSYAVLFLVNLWLKSLLRVLKLPNIDTKEPE